MRINRLISAFIIATIVAIAATPSMAVTEKEMEEARANAAKIYLRWSNNASGYLDEINVKSMSDLNANLKPKEKENIKAFNAVKTPSDYASWDKEKLAEYWAVTFLKSSGLNPDGTRQGASSAIKSKIMSMTISAPSTASAPAVAATSQAEEQVVTSQAEAETPTAQEAVAEQEDILADQNAIQNDAAMAEESREPESSNTWVYILVLAILVAVVIWLVVYAANLMKRQSADAEITDGDAGKIREQARAAIAKKDEEIKKLKERLQREEGRNAELGLEMERIKLDNTRLQKQVEKMRGENRNSMKEPVRERHDSFETHEHVSTPTPVSEERTKAKEEKTVKPENKEILKVIYLGRANRRGIFVRADRRINPGNTIYRLDTNDGMVGTFHVVDEPEVLETAFSNPAEYLSTGCTGEDLEDTIGVTRIVTESAGTAIFEQGYWKVLRKTKIRYE